MERKNQRISDLFYNNRFLLVFSVVAAIALWLVVAVEYGPEATKKVEVNVQADFEYIKKNFGLTCFGNYDKEIDVTIKGQRLVVDSDDIPNQIDAKLELGAITRTGEFPVTISVTKKSDSFSDFEIIDNTASAYYMLFFDKEVTETYTVVPDINPSVDGDRYAPEDYNLEMDKIKVTGPSSKLSKIKSVVARNPDKTEINETTDITAQILLIDGNGNVINAEENYLTLSAKEIKITVPVYYKRNMDIGCRFINRPAKYVDEHSVPFILKFSPSSANVAVSESMKDQNLLEICDVDYSKIYNGVFSLEDISVETIDGCYFLDSTENISVEVDASSLGDKTVGISDDSVVSYENVPEGKKHNTVSIDFETVRMIGPKESVDALETADLKIIVDMAQIPEDFEGEIQVPAFIESEDCWSYSGENEYYVTVNVE